MHREVQWKSELAVLFVLRWASRSLGSGLYFLSALPMVHPKAEPVIPVLTSERI